MIEQGAADPVLRTQIRIVEESGQQLLNIINDVLDLSKISEGGPVLHSNRSWLHDTVGDFEMDYLDGLRRRGFDSAPTWALRYRRICGEMSRASGRC